MFQFKYIILFWFLLSSILLSAQDEVTPLIEKLPRLNGIEKIDLLNEVSVIYRKTDRYKSLDYAKQAFRHSIKENYLPGKALAKKNEGICWFFFGSNDSATLCYKQALEIYTELKDEKGMSACFNNLGLIAQETGKYDEALGFYQRSIEIDQKLGDEIGMALTLENMADIYMYRGDARKALSFTNKCINIYKEQSYKPGLMSSYSNRASEYDYLMKYNESIRDYKRALSLARELKDKYQEVMATSNMGVIYWHMGKTEIAMKYLNNAMMNSDETDDAYNIDNTLKTIAQIYTSQQQYTKANEILFKILRRNNDINNERQAAVIMTAIGRNLIELNEIDKALGYLSKSLEITVDLDAPYEKLENYRNLAHAHAILHNFKTADSLQDLFAHTYSLLFNGDSIADNKKNDAVGIGNQNKMSSTQPISIWLVAFSLIIIIILFSALAFSEKQKKNL